MRQNFQVGGKQKTGNKKIENKLLRVLFIVSFLFILSRGSGEAFVAGTVEIHGLYSIGKEEFLELLGLRPGGPVDEERIKKGIKTTFLKGIFEDISVEVSEDSAHDIVVNVRERDILRKIYVEGNYQISKKKIAELFLLKQGDVMRHDMIQQATEGLKKELSLLGFPHAEIDCKIDKVKEPSRVDLHIVIDSGPPLIIKTLHIVGTDLDIKGSLKLSEGAIYDQHKLSNGLKLIARHLKKQGYYHPAVGPYHYTEGELEIVVNPGKKLIIAIEGNHAISTKDLMKQLPFFEIETFNDEVVSEAIDKMLLIYHEKGYASAQIAPVTSAADDTIHVTFFIFEGERYRVKNIKFIGAELPYQKLLDVLNLKKDGLYNPDVLEKDRDALKEIYVALGYLEIEVKAFETKIDGKEHAVEITVTVLEGQRTEISAIDIVGVDSDMKKKLMEIVRIKQGDPYNEIDISDARFRIIDFLNNHGYVNMDVDVMRDIDEHKASLKFSVSEGMKKFFGTTIITGNNKTRYTVIKRELMQKEGEAYSSKILADGRQRLYKLGLFTEVDMESLDAGGDKKDILVKVKEGDAGAVEFGFGYADYEQFRSFFEVNYRNLWGMNRQGLFRTELSTLQRRILLQYYEPWFMGYNLPFRAFALTEHKTELNIPSRNTLYKLDRYTLSAGFEHKIADTVKADIYYEFSLVRTTDVQSDIILSREDVGTLAISSIKPSLVYDTRDNPIDPSKGVLAGVSLKIASPVLLSQSNFAKFIFYGSIFQKIERRVILGLSLRGGLAYGFGTTDELPIVERFFLGGRASVRGYDQDTLGPKGADGNPTGGNAFLMGNIELRTSIGRGFSLVPFLDFGNVWIKAGDMNPAHLKYTTGLGLRYNTPVGPLRVDYGIKLERETGESFGALHFSIGHAF